jgi:hypothetical protein
MSCQHEIEGEDYGECTICGAQFFKTSSGLWQSYDDGSRQFPKSDGRPSRGNANVGDRIGRTRRPAHPKGTIPGGPIGPSERRTMAIPSQQGKSL